MMVGVGGGWLVACRGGRYMEGGLAGRCGWGVGRWGYIAEEMG